jgi:hypothetical protein
MSRADAISAWEGSDPELGSLEKETSLVFAMPDEEFRLHTDEPSVGRKIIAHSEASDIQLGVLLGGDRRASVCLEEHSGERVVAVQATLPVGVLSIKSQARANDRHSHVVSAKVLEGVVR